MEPWVSWTAFLTAAGGLAWYYTRDIRTANSQRDAGKIPLDQDTATQPTARRRNKESKPAPQKASLRDQTPTGASTSTDLNTDGGSKKKRKGAKPSSSTAQVTPPVPVQTSAADEEDDAADDQEWAAQLAAAKKGVSLEKKQSSGKKNKAVALPENSSKDVSDMLPEPAPGPSSIRITGGEEQKKQAQKASKQEEKRNKKQRQNDRKKEEARQQREADEEQRQKLLEQQRRTAREARGEPAKNGLAPAPSSNAWKASNSSTPVAATTASAAPLLDTFEQEATSNASDNEPVTTATTPATNASTYDHDGYILSEEAQREIDNVLNPWEEVGGKAKKVKKTQSSSNVSAPTEPANGTIVEPATKVVSTGVVQPAPEKRENTKAPKPQTKSKVSAANPFAVLESAQTYFKGQPHEGDSDWVVA